MLLAGIILLFVIGYIVIALEHPLHIDKAATALFIGASCWALYLLGLDTLLPSERIPDIFRAEMAAGGAWTVIGDVTTTMLWIGNKISTIEVMRALILPSLACMILPLIIASLMLKGDVERPERAHEHLDKSLKSWHSNLFLALGFCGLVFVPIFKSLTHLPPFMGMMFSLSVIWIISEFVKHDLDETTRSSTNVVGVLKKIDTASILFFLGILLAVGTLQSTGVLRLLAGWLTEHVPNMQMVALVIGLLAAGIGMYDFPKDDTFWLFLAYCAGTGGSCLVIGSAAGVAAMGLERIDFLWYIRRISLWALVGYLGGAGVFLIQEKVISHDRLPVQDEQIEPHDGHSNHATFEAVCY